MVVLYTGENSPVAKRRMIDVLPHFALPTTRTLQRNLELPPERRRRRRVACWLAASGVALDEFAVLGFDAKAASGVDNAALRFRLISPSGVRVKAGRSFPCDDPAGGPTKGMTNPAPRGNVDPPPRPRNPFRPPPSMMGDGHARVDGECGR